MWCRLLPPPVTAAGRLPGMWCRLPPPLGRVMMEVRQTGHCGGEAAGYVVSSVAAACNCGGETAGYVVSPAAAARPGDDGGPSDGTLRRGDCRVCGVVCCRRL